MTSFKLSRLSLGLALRLVIIPRREIFEIVLSCVGIPKFVAGAAVSYVEGCNRWFAVWLCELLLAEKAGPKPIAQRFYGNDSELRSIGPIVHVSSPPQLLADILVDRFRKFNLRYLIDITYISPSTCGSTNKASARLSNTIYGDNVFLLSDVKVTLAPSGLSLNAVELPFRNAFRLINLSLSVPKFVAGPEVGDIACSNSRGVIFVGEQGVVEEKRPGLIGVEPHREEAKITLVAPIRHDRSIFVGVLGRLMIGIINCYSQRPNEVPPIGLYVFYTSFNFQYQIDGWHAPVPPIVCNGETLERMDQSSCENIVSLTKKLVSRFIDRNTVILPLVNAFRVLHIDLSIPDFIADHAQGDVVSRSGWRVVVFSEQRVIKEDRPCPVTIESEREQTNIAFETPIGHDRSTSVRVLPRLMIEFINFYRQWLNGAPLIGLSFLYSPYNFRYQGDCTLRAKGNVHFSRGCLVNDQVLVNI